MADNSFVSASILNFNSNSPDNTAQGLGLSSRYRLDCFFHIILNLFHVITHSNNRSTYDISTSNSFPACSTITSTVFMLPPFFKKLREQYKCSNNTNTAKAFIHYFTMKRIN